MMHDPKAIEPRWYLKIQENPVKSEPLPLVSLVNEKYQMHTEAAMMNWAQPMMNALIQRRPKTW